MKEVGLPQEVYILLNELIIERYGIEFPEHRKEILASRLRPRLESLRLRSYWDYYLHLRADNNGERQRLAEVVTNNETFFFREVQQMESFFTAAVPRLKPVGKKLRVLCAGCSSGEEPYTLSMLAAARGIPLAIDAFDIDTSRIAAARRAEYGRTALRQLSDEQRDTCFQPAGPETWTLRPAYREDIRFAWGNIAEPETFALHGLYDTVFCRNVLIYFSPAAILRAVHSFAGVLRPGGFLFLGSSESIIGLSDRFETLRLPGTIAYRRVAS